MLETNENQINACIRIYKYCTVKSQMFMGIKFTVFKDTVTVKFDVNEIFYIQSPKWYVLLQN